VKAFLSFIIYVEQIKKNPQYAKSMNLSLTGRNDNETILENVTRDALHFYRFSSNLHVDVVAGLSRFKCVKLKGVP